MVGICREHKKASVHLRVGPDYSCLYSDSGVCCCWLARAVHIAAWLLVSLGLERIQQLATRKLWLPVQRIVSIPLMYRQQSEPHKPVACVTWAACIGAHGPIHIWTSHNPSLSTSTSSLDPAVKAQKFHSFCFMQSVGFYVESCVWGTGV
jgi:hypothetical protein